MLWIVSDLVLYEIDSHGIGFIILGDNIRCDDYLGSCGCVIGAVGCSAGMIGVLL